MGYFYIKFFGTCIVSSVSFFACAMDSEIALPGEDDDAWGLFSDIETPSLLADIQQTISSIADFVFKDEGSFRKQCPLCVVQACLYDVDELKDHLISGHTQLELELYVSDAVISVPIVDQGAAEASILPISPKPSKINHELQLPVRQKRKNNNSCQVKPRSKALALRLHGCSYVNKDGIACSYQTYRLTDLKKHKDTHNEKTAFKCMHIYPDGTSCHYSGKSQATLNVHAVRHSTKESFNCSYRFTKKGPLCGHAAVSIEDLYNHRVVIHKARRCDYVDEDGNPCPYAAKTYEFNMHKLCHLSKKCYVCKKCSYKTNSLSHFNRHRKAKKH